MEQNELHDLTVAKTCPASSCEQLSPIMRGWPRQLHSASAHGGWLLALPSIGNLNLV